MRKNRIPQKEGKVMINKRKHFTRKRKRTEEKEVNGWKRG